MDNIKPTHARIKAVEGGKVSIVTIDQIHKFNAHPPANNFDFDKKKIYHVYVSNESEEESTEDTSFEKVEEYLVQIGDLASMLIINILFYCNKFSVFKIFTNKCLVQRYLLFH